MKLSTKLMTLVAFALLLVVALTGVFGTTSVSADGPPTGPLIIEDGVLFSQQAAVTAAVDIDVGASAAMTAFQLDTTIALGTTQQIPKSKALGLPWQVIALTGTVTIIGAAYILYAFTNKTQHRTVTSWFQRMMTTSTLGQTTMRRGALGGLALKFPQLTSTFSSVTRKLRQRGHVFLIEIRSILGSVLGILGFFVRPTSTSAPA